jgi:hypothetical protein
MWAAASSKPKFGCLYSHALVAQFDWKESTVVRKTKLKETVRETVGVGRRKDANRTRFSSVEMKRLDDEQFTILRDSNVAFYVFFNVTGLELIRVVDLVEGLAADGTSTVKVRFWRVLPTERALAQSTRMEDMIDPVENSRGTYVPASSLGRTSLQGELDRQQNDHTGRNVFHWGDVQHECDAGNIVGFLGWMPHSEFRRNQLERKELVQAEANLLTNLKRVKKELKTKTDFDWVVVGSPFCDVPVSN